MVEISIIVPVYNTEKYLHRCLDSILAQTFRSFELILVDDGSTDKSGLICEEYSSSDDRVRVIHKRNEGQASARNEGLDWIFTYSNSSWITYIDSDDWVHPLYLEHLLKSATEAGTRISSCSFIKTAGDVPRVDTKRTKVIPVKSDYIREDKKIITYVWGRLYDRELWRDVRFPSGRLWEDSATAYKVLFSAERTAYVDEVLYYYYINQEGTVNREWRSSRMDEILAYEEQLEYFGSKPEYREIYKILQGAYIRAISYSYFKEQESKLPSDEKRYYARIIRRKIRSALLKYRKTADISFSKDYHVYDTAYPKLMWFYWAVYRRLCRDK